MAKAPGLLSLPPEVLQKICSDLMISTNGDDTYTRSYTGTQTVLALARTVKSLHEYAVNAIWHTLPGYGFLLFAVPRDAWEETEVQTQWSRETRVVRLSSLILAVNTADPLIETGSPPR